MCELEKIVKANDIKPDEVERIHVKSNRQLPGNLTYHQPHTGLEGKFSIEYNAAAVLLDGKLTLACAAGRRESRGPCRESRPRRAARPPGR